MSPDEPTTYLLRVWLPDRPGALGAVASRIGAVGADIVAVDVVDRDGGQAVDDIVIEIVPERIDLLLREVRAVDGIDVEELHLIDKGYPDLGLGVLAASTEMVAATTSAELAACLCVHARRVVRLDWTALCHGDDGSVLAVEGNAPTEAWLGAYAMGIGPVTGEGAGAEVTLAGDDPQLAVARLSGSPLVLSGGRRALSIRPRERALLVALVGIASARWAGLGAEAARVP